MQRTIDSNTDYLVARLHGRRSRMAEAERLDALCRTADLPTLYHAMHPDLEFRSSADFQRRVTHDLLREMTGILKHLSGAGGDLVAWMRIRFQLENIKVLLRRFMQRSPLENPEEQLLNLPPDLALDAQALLEAKSLAEFAARLPASVPRITFKKALLIYRDRLRPFFLEAALDQGYFQELIARTDPIPEEEKEFIRPIMLQEADAFHLMLVVRGRFHYGVSANLLSPLHIRSTRIPRQRFNAMMSAPNALAAARLVVDRVIDALPPTQDSTETTTEIAPTLLEALAWKRFWRLSNRAFRRSHMGVGAVIGYLGVRRVEVANLVTLSEGVRTRTAAEAIRRHLISQSIEEGPNV